MSVKLITENIWDELTKAAKNSKIKSFVAVAYFGKGGAERLPLSKGSSLLVDASDNAVTNGITCPEELLKLYYKGVRIFSKENLHAKLFIIGKTLYVGSTNVSLNSEKCFKEAVLKTTDKSAIKDAKLFIQEHCNTPELGDANLKRLMKIYKPSKNFKKEFSTKSKSEINLPAFYVCNLDLVNYSNEEEKQSQIGKQEALQKIKNISRHKIDEFQWTKSHQLKIDDIILQITNEGSRSYVSPPGQLIHMRNWSNGVNQKVFCYVEVPKQRRKNQEYLKKHLNKNEYKFILQNGPKNTAIAAKITSLWN